MDDIVEKLRACSPLTIALAQEAADEIEQLRARLAEEPRPPVLDDATVFDPGPVPELFRLCPARLALREPRNLVYAFYWKYTKQGYEFWERQRNLGLTDEGRKIIEHWLAETA